MTRMTHSQSGPIRGLYAITPDEADTGQLVSMVRQGLLGGVRLVQYRNKSADYALRLRQASALRALTRQFSVPLLVNDDAPLALRAGADGVHIGKDDGTVAAARALLGGDKIIGVSCYNRLDLAHRAVREGADYVAFGSFFDSAVKPNAVATSPDLLVRARQQLGVPLVAIGGITACNGAQLIEAGADALAVISALFGASNIADAARALTQLCCHRTKFEQKEII